MEASGPMIAGWKFKMLDSEAPFGLESNIIVKVASFDEAKAMALKEFGASSVIIDHTPLSEKDLSAYTFSGLTHKLPTRPSYEQMTRGAPWL
jgi:hypothetical protein